MPSNTGRWVTRSWPGLVIQVSKFFQNKSKGIYLFVVDDTEQESDVSEPEQDQVSGFANIDVFIYFQINKGLLNNGPSNVTLKETGPMSITFHFLFLLSIHLA